MNRYGYQTFKHGQFCFHTKICKKSNKLTPWSRVLLDKLTGPQLVKKLSAFFGIRRFITVFTIVLILNQKNPVHAPPIPLLEDPF